MLYGITEISNQFNVPTTLVTEWAEEHGVATVNGAFIFDDDDHAAFTDWLETYEPNEADEADDLDAEDDDQLDDDGEEDPDDHDDLEPNEDEDLPDEVDDDEADDDLEDLS